MTISRNSHFVSISLFLVVAGCDTKPPEPKIMRGHYAVEALGELPKAPNSEKPAEVISLVQQAGEAPTFKTKSLTTLRAGNNLSCEIKAREQVLAIGDAGSRFLVHVDKTALSKPCPNSGDADFVEGYVEKSELEFVANAEPIQQSPRELVETNEPAQVTTPTSTVAPATTAAPAESDSFCDSVSMGSADNKRDPNVFLLFFSNSYDKKGKSRIPGQLWRTGGEEFFLKVDGKAERWKVQAINKSKSNKKMDAKILKSSELKKASKGGIIIPFKKFVENPNDWMGVSINIVVTPMSESGTAGEKKCVKQIDLMSPLVLDFSNREFIQTKSITQAGVDFDLNADGILEQVGWVDGKDSAFLVRDLNGNGQIDNGSEMFGDSTYLKSSRTTAADGFAALAQYDTNGDSKIDANDAEFSKLKLWFDRNGNGKTDSGELVSLTDKQVSYVSLTSKAVPRSLALQHAEGVPNDVRTRGVFGAKGCPSSGCNMYDVYFGTFGQRAVTLK